MYIKTILEHDYNYAEYVVTDGKNDLKCMCLSVPLSNGQIPKIGMKVEMLYAFSINSIKLKKVSTLSNEPFKIQSCSYFGYFLQAQVFDAINALVKVGELIISLENDYPSGFPKHIKINDFVEFFVDRIDCVLEDLIY
ncbi:MAG: hypothetical protein IKK20_02930 [Clostridia bacterium]|nr:hypothetical protein [Clostridia bacterium]